MQISIIRVPAKEYLIIHEASCTAKTKEFFLFVLVKYYFF